MGGTEMKKLWYSFYYKQAAKSQRVVGQSVFAGKLNFYVTAADKLLRGKDDNPSVGLLICKIAKKTIVEWSLQDIQKPLGVATYQLQEVVDPRTRTVLRLRKPSKN